MRGLAATLDRRRRAGRRLALPSLSARLRRRLLVAAALFALLAAGYQFWLRDSSLVAVEEVQVTGLSTKDAERVRGALEIAARSMTTLHVQPERLQQAIDAYPVVSALEVDTDFPHGLTIRVIEYRPAALAVVHGREVPVARDGTLLTGLAPDGGLPRIEAENARDGRLSGAAALDAAWVAGGAPAPLERRIEAVTARRGDGLVVKLKNGPELIFGDVSRAGAKWIAAARVLADPDAEGATYIDVRLPGRPAAGGLPAATVTPVAPVGSPATPAPGTAAAGAATPTAPATPVALAAPPVTPAAPTPAAGTVGADPATGAPLPTPGVTAGAEATAGGVAAPAE